MLSHLSVCNVFPERLWTSFVVLTTVEKKGECEILSRHTGGGGGVTFFSYIRRAGEESFHVATTKTTKAAPQNYERVKREA